MTKKRGKKGKQQKGEEKQDQEDQPTVSQPAAASPGHVPVAAAPQQRAPAAAAPQPHAPVVQQQATAAAVPQQRAPAAAAPQPHAPAVQQQATAAVPQQQQSQQQGRKSKGIGRGQGGGGITPGPPGIQGRGQGPRQSQPPPGMAAPTWGPPPGQAAPVAWGPKTQTPQPSPPGYGVPQQQQQQQPYQQMPQQMQQMPQQMQQVHIQPPQLPQLGARPKAPQQMAPQQQAGAQQPQPQRQQQQQIQPPQQQAGAQQQQQQQQQKQHQQQQQKQQQQQQQKQQQQQPQQRPPTASPVKGSTMSTAEISKNWNLIPRRRDPQRAGTQGRKITVEANVVPIMFNNLKSNCVHYDVAFDPDKPRFMMRPAFEAVRKKFFPKRYPAYDGRKNVFSVGLLPFGECISDEVTVWDHEREQDRTYKFTLKKVQDIDLSFLKNVAAGTEESNQTALQAVDVVLRNGPAARCVQVGRSFFQPPVGHVANLSGGLELWVGMFQSAILGWKPFLNLDVAHKGFPKAQGVIQLMDEMSGGRGYEPRNRDSISKYLKGLKVIYEIPGQPTSRRTQRVNELVTNAYESVFKLDNGQSTTVMEYYKKEKHYIIKYPNLPCVWIGGRQRQIYVPAELCTIVGGQVTMKKMDENQTSAMIKYAATSTEVRKEKIMNAFAAIKFNDDPCVKEFGLSVGGGFEKVPARVLEPPQLMYDRPVVVKKGVWRAAKFNQAATLEPEKWTILNLNGSYTKDRELYTLTDELLSCAQECGMTLGKPLTPFVNLPPPQRDLRNIIDFFSSKKTQQLKLIIVVVPDRGNAYSKVKQVAELRVGVLTQCVRARTVFRLTRATTGNILLKINSKLNGVNHTFMEQVKPPCLKEPCIIIGADVTHPSPDAVDIPSIAAVAASHDPKAFQYNIKIQLQPPREEIILELETIIRQQLMFFYKKTGQRPLRIIFYRDGVSEGQFVQVMHRELTAIQRACRSLQKDGSYQPPITFLVVQKRHHVRLFPTDMRNSDDRNHNVQAGTVVDTMITHPSHIDFYLVSHASIQGVARPTKYRCLWDDKKMTEDEIEQLTYYLCHMFSRCTRSVSYPAPTYYAHLAAYRARALIDDIMINIHNLDEEQRTKLTLAADMASMPMFFV